MNGCDKGNPGQRDRGTGGAALTGVRGKIANSAVHGCVSLIFI